MVSYSCLFRPSRKGETLGTWEGFRLPYSFLPSFARKLTDSESDHPSNTVHKITPLRAHDPTLKENLNVNSLSIEKKEKKKKRRQNPEKNNTVRTTVEASAKREPGEVVSRDRLPVC